MKELLITTGNQADFFVRGRQLAVHVDQGERIPNNSVMYFEDIEDIFELLTKSRIKLLQEVKTHPGSVSQIATAIGRGRSAVSRDLYILLNAGLLEISVDEDNIQSEVKIFRVVAEQIRLEASLF